MIEGAYRLHVEGDWVNEDELAAVSNTCRETPGIDIMTYTKKYGLVNEYIKKHGALPHNLIQLFSAWDGLKMDNPFHLPMFVVAKNISEYQRLTDEYGSRGRNCQHVKANGDGTYTVTVGRCDACYINHLKGNGRGGCWDMRPADSAENVMAVIALAH